MSGRSLSVLPGERPAAVGAWRSSRGWSSARLPACLALAVVVLVASCGRQDHRGPALPASPPVIDVVQLEYRFEHTGSIPRGRVVIRAANHGRLAHDLTLARLPPDFPPIDEQLQGSARRVVPTVASLLAHQPGTTGTFATDLSPGRYAFICFVEDADGVRHSVKGMSSEFRVR